MENEEFKTGLKWWAKLIMMVLATLVITVNYTMFQAMGDWSVVTPAHIFVGLVLLITTSAAISLLITPFYFQFRVSSSGVSIRRFLVRDKEISYNEIKGITIGGYLIYAGITRGNVGIDFAYQNWQTVAELIAKNTSGISGLKISGNKKAVKEYFGNHSAEL